MGRWESDQFCRSWSNGVIPFAVEIAAGDVDGGQLIVGDGDAFWVARLIKTTANGEAGIGARCSDEFDDDLVGKQRLSAPVMKEKRRCSILFHLEVPGGRWRMIRVRPVSSASRWSSAFHSRLRALLLPPLSAVMTR